jgi:hypothetical protein
MRLEKIGDFDLRYTALEFVEYAAGGQYYGTLEGRVDGARLTGTLRLTNLAVKRPDDVNMPTLRGLLHTDDGADVWVEMDGVSTLRPADEARVFVAALRCRSGVERYLWLNTVVGVVDGVLIDERARGEVYECQATAR